MTDQPVNGRALEVARALRKDRARKLGVYFAVFVGVPTTVSAVYHGAIRSPEYESVAVLSLRSGEAVDDDRQSILPARGKGNRELDLVRAQVLSRTMVEALARDHGLREHYASPSVDRWSRLGPDAYDEEIYSYYLGKVFLAQESGGATSTLRVRAFSRRYANDLAHEIVRASQERMERESRIRVARLISPAEVQVREAEAVLAGPVKASQIETARARLAAALNGLEVARAEAITRSPSLAVIDRPSMPITPVGPGSLAGILSVFVTSLALGGVLWLLFASVREHANF